MLSNETLNFLININQSSDYHNKINDKIINELRPYRPKREIELYRGLSFFDIEDFVIKTKMNEFPERGDYLDFCTGFHWSYSVDIAIEFTELNSFGLLLHAVVDPSEVLCDVQLLPTDVRNQLEWSDEDEVILLYSVASQVHEAFTPHNYRRCHENL